MSGELVYFELPAKDAEATQRFWGSLFGWTFHEGNVPGYSMIDGSAPLAGSPHGDPSPHPRVFFGVDDVTTETRRVRELGGTTEEPVTIPAGTFARCTDDQGVQFTLFEPARTQ